MKSADGWTTYAYTGDGDVRVDAGCPGPSSEVSAEAPHQADYDLMLIMVREADQKDDIRRFHYTFGGSEQVPVGDTWMPVTRIIHIAELALCNPEWARGVLLEQLGLGGDVRFTIIPQPCNLPPIPQRTDGFLAANRTSVGMCVDTIDVPDKGKEFLRQKILDAIPQLRADRAWNQAFPPGPQYVPVTVQLDCPALAPHANFVDQPSDNLLFIFIAPLDQVQALGRRDAQERVCQGDFCYTATQWLLLTQEDICDNERLVAILIAVLVGHEDSDVLGVPTHTPFFDAPPQFGVTPSPVPTQQLACF